MNNQIESLKNKGLKLDWNLNSSDENTIVVYIATDESESSVEKFKERVKTAIYHKVITNLKSISSNVLSLKKEEVYEVMKDLCDYFYPYHNGLNTCAITGTNGKTTTVDFIRQLLMIKKQSVLTIGTMGVYFNEKRVDDFSLTSPHYIDFRKMINKYQLQLDFLAVESSSHAIDQKRQYRFQFDFIGWTSFSQDHLDYHKDLEEYFNVKKKLQEQCKNKFIISKKAGTFKEKIEREEVDYSLETKNQFLRVDYNKINLDVALGILERFNLKFSTDEIDKIKPTPGRFNVFDNKDQLIIIDFAHSPDGLENILISINKSFNKKVVCVFGCGGNRDKTKRPLMGSIAEKLSDNVIVTSDNPRDEEPQAIIDDIIMGLKDKNVISMVDRKEAIEYAIKNYPDSIILIAGKGHEDYLEAKGKRTKYSDINVVKEVLKC